MEKTTTKTTTVMKPHRLFDHLIVTYKLKNDRQLARYIGVAPSTVCKIRARTKKMTPMVILKVYDYSKMPIDSIRELSK
jgi:plasmid maintenance system antidote protein VapI